MSYERFQESAQRRLESLLTAPEDGPPPFQLDATSDQNGRDLAARLDASPSDDDDIDGI